MSGLAVLGMVVLSRKHWAGWVLLAVSEVLFVVDTVASARWGYLLASAFLLFTYCEAFVR